MGKNKKEYFLILILAFCGAFGHFVLGLDVYETISVLLLLSISILLIMILDKINGYLEKK